MPGYIIHLTEAEEILQILGREYGYRLTEDWKRLFSLGCLLPDTRTGQDKEGSHFWDPAESEHLAKAPDLERFCRSYPELAGEGGAGKAPGMLGYWTHLHLDHCYVCDFWRRTMRFTDAEGTEKINRKDICRVQLLATGETIDEKDFFTSEYYYGDYSRMNAWLTQKYDICIPEYRGEEWEEFPVTEVDPEKLRMILAELGILMKNQDPEGYEHLRVFRVEELENFIRETAETAAAVIDKILRGEADMEDVCRPSKMCGGRVDLHAHTCCSDGSLKPAELVRLAKEKGLKALAVTDHDTMAGVREAQEEGRKLGIEIIPGMEFSTKEDGHDIHMVGLFLDPDSPAIREVMAFGTASRNKRNARMIDNLRNMGMEITEEDVKSLGSGIWTRGNLAGLLAEKGYAESVKDAMNKYLVHGAPAYVSRQCLTPVEAVKAAHEAGGLAIVAHFHQIDRKDPENSLRIAEKILQAGADGLETRYCEFTPELREMAEKLADKYGCLRSGGSDFHGKIKPGLELADGYGDLWVPENYLGRMKERMAEKNADK